MVFDVYMKDAKILQDVLVQNEDSDQSALMCRLVCNLAVCIYSWQPLDNAIAGILSKKSKHFYKINEHKWSFFYKIHYENTPIQIYWKFHHQKLKVFR